jgi:Flp pilus assembly protein TadD
MNLYEKNLALLKDRCPACANWLEKAADDPRIEILEISPGKIDLRVIGKNQKRFLFYNTPDPLEKERSLFQEQKFEKNCATFLIGIGLGYSLSVIAEKMEDRHTLVVIECNPTILKSALKAVDLNLLFQKDSRIIFCPPEAEIVEQVATKIFLGETGFDAPDDVKILLHQASSNISEEYNKWFRQIEDLYCYYMVNLKTCTHCAHPFALNEVSNLPMIVSSPGIGRLKDSFPEIPAVVVSAGPSLHKNVHLLKKIQNRALIIATAPVLRVLLAHDIRPHLIASMDFGEDNYLAFEGVCEQEEVPLVFLTRLYPRALFDYQGDLIVVPQNGGIIQWLGQYWGKKGGLPGCSNVGLFCFYIAEAFGAEPIILIGQDLSFSQDFDHTEGIVGRRKVSPKDEKFIWVEGNLGERVPVTTAFLAYIRQFKEAVAGSRKLCINATEGGASIEGTVIMTFQEAIQTYCCQEMDIAGRIKAVLEKNFEDSPDYPGLLAEMEKGIKSLRRIKKLSQKGLKLNQKIRKRFAKLENREEGKLDQLLKENYRVSTEVQRFSDSFNLFKIYMAREIYEINRGKYLPEPDKIYDPQVMDTGLKRNRLILQAAERTADELSKELSKSRNLIREFYQCWTAVSKDPENAEAQFHWGRILLRMGYGKKARAALLRSLELGMNGPDILFNLVDCYQKGGYFEEARKILSRLSQKDSPLTREVREKMSFLEDQEKKWLQQAKRFRDERDWINTLIYSRKISKMDAQNMAEAEELIWEALQARETAILEGERQSMEWRLKWEARQKYKHLFEWGKRLFDRGRFEEAAAVFHRALALPSIETLEAQVLLACTYSELGKIRKAEELLREAMARFPERALFNVNLGRAYLRNGYIPEALRELEAAIEKDSRFYEHHMEIGNIYFHNRNYEKALIHFEQYLTHNRGSYEALTKAGNCKLARGLIDAAEAYYRKALSLKPDYPAAQIGVSTVDRLKNQRGHVANQRLNAKGVEA